MEFIQKFDYEKEYDKSMLEKVGLSELFLEKQEKYILSNEVEKRAEEKTKQDMVKANMNREEEINSMIQSIFQSEDIQKEKEMQKRIYDRDSYIVLSDKLVEIRA